MNIEEAKKYARQRMREYGKQVGEYHWEPVYVSVPEDQEDDESFTVKAYNELYIIVNPENYSGVFILADNSSFHTDNPEWCGVPEFTGRIRFIKAGETWTFDTGGGKMEFLRVVY